VVLGSARFHRAFRPSPGPAHDCAAQEQLLNHQQGTAARAFLYHLVRDERAKGKLKEYSDEFIGQYKDSLSAPAQGRLARHVATARAAARLAIEYRVLPWSVRNTDKDLATCLFAALDWMSDDHSDGKVTSNEELLTTFLSAIADLKTLDVDNRKKSSLTAREIEQHDAFRRTLKGEQEPILLVKSSWVKTRYSKDVRKRLFAVCVDRGMMTERGRSRDTQTHQEKLGGKPIEVYRITTTRA
jgi:hypothetical protein